jgi:hypothetical protein
VLGVLGGLGVPGFPGVPGVLALHVPDGVVGALVGGVEAGVDLPEENSASTACFTYRLLFNQPHLFSSLLVLCE